jgi:hypothetical protein
VAGKEEMYVKWSSNHDGKRVFVKKHFCLFCRTASTNLTKHLLNRHKKEKVVQKILAASLKSKFRKHLLEKLRHLGDFQHNCEVKSSGEGEILPWRSPPERVSASEYVPCPDCFAFFQQDHLWRHYKDCAFCMKSDRKHNFRSLKTEAELLIPSSNEVSAGLENNILRMMNIDENSILISNDATITKYDENLFQKHGHTKHLHNHISSKMRELAQLVMAVKNLGSSVKWLADCLHPSKFDVVVKAVR